MSCKRFKGRVVRSGTAKGLVLKSKVPLGLFGHLDPKTGVYKETGHPLDGCCVTDKVLVFPRAKGSTVGSYILYALRKSSKAPAAMLLSECDTIVAVGAIISGIPTVDKLDLSKFTDDALVRVKDGEVSIEKH